MIPVVLYGRTGCGKTSLLRELHHRNLPVIDLEFLARHRGSAFGQINIIERQPSQTSFEESILLQLENVCNNDFVFIEHEAMNIGKLRLPGAIIQLYKNGISVLLKASLEQRVKNILQEYLPTDKSQLFNSLEKMKDRLAPGFYIELHSLLVNDQYHQFCSAILNYYDQAKQYNPEKEFICSINDQGATINANQLLDWLHHHVVAAFGTTGSTLS